MIKLGRTIRRVLSASAPIQPAAMGHGQSLQIGIGDLARTEDALSANQTLLVPADLLGPEGMAGMAAGLGQTGGHLLARPAFKCLRDRATIDLFVAHELLIAGRKGTESGHSRSVRRLG